MESPPGKCVASREAAGLLFPFFAMSLQQMAGRECENITQAASRAFILQVTEGKRKLGWVGLEPTTNALKGRCSTIELPTRKL